MTPEPRAIDVRGVLTRTAPHLLAFRDWLAAECSANPRRTFVNATSAGFPAGPRIRQRVLDRAVEGGFPRPAGPYAEQIAALHAASAWKAAAGPAALAALLAQACQDDTLAAWERFVAPSATSDAIVAAAGEAAATLTRR